MTESDLAKLLHTNPDLGIIGPVSDNALAAMARAAKPPKLSEHEMQAAVFEECERRALTNPDWQMVVAVPNGQYRPGQRMEAGLKSGFPDIIVPVACHSRIGLALELKVAPNKPTEDQLTWHRQLRIRNWAVDVIYDDPQKVIDHIEWYLEK